VAGASDEALAGDTDRHPRFTILLWVVLVAVRQW
jgi:hypothetical protein